MPTPFNEFLIIFISFYTRRYNISRHRSNQSKEGIGKLLETVGSILKFVGLYFHQSVDRFQLYAAKHTIAI